MKWEKPGLATLCWSQITLEGQLLDRTLILCRNESAEASSLTEGITGCKKKGSSRRWNRRFSKFGERSPMHGRFRLGTVKLLLGEVPCWAKLLIEDRSLLIVTGSNRRRPKLKTEQAPGWVKNSLQSGIRRPTAGWKKVSSQFHIKV